MVFSLLRSLCWRTYALHTNPVSRLTLGLMNKFTALLSYESLRTHQKPPKYRWFFLYSGLCADALCFANEAAFGYEACPSPHMSMPASLHIASGNASLTNGEKYDILN